MTSATATELLLEKAAGNQLSEVWIVALFVSLGTVPLRGQRAPDPQEPISTDRPADANSSVAVPKGDLQVENGLLITNAQGQRALDLPETSLRFGLLNKTELRLAVPDYFDDLPTGTAASSGFGDVALGVKQQLGPIHRDFDIAMAGNGSGSVTRDSNFLGPTRSPGIGAPAGRWRRTGPRSPARRTFTGESTFFLDRQLTKPWDAFGEYAGDFPQQGGPRHLVHLGTAYKLALRHQIDFHVAVGLSGAAPDSFVGVGYSFLIRPAR